jgi:hypothetical protein
MRNINRSMACVPIFYKFLFSRAFSLPLLSLSRFRILSYKCSYLFYNIQHNNFYSPFVCAKKRREKESESKVEYLKWLWRYNKSERARVETAKANVSEKEEEKVEKKCGGGKRDGDEEKKEGKYYI